MSRQPITYLGLALLSTLVLVALLVTAVSARRWGQAVLPGSSSRPVDTPDVGASPVHLPLAQPSNESVRAQAADTLCLFIYTGTIRSTFVISNAEGVSGFYDMTLANFRQRLLWQSSTAMGIEVTTYLYLDTDAPYPVQLGALPGDVQQYLLPELAWIQSDDAAIMAKARELVHNAKSQAEAVDAVVAWVRANTHYSTGYPNDALSVFENGIGACMGFSTLTAALLRAAGIPARDYYGCVGPWGWMTGPEGLWHAWDEVYYPDVGWVALDPQTTINYVDTTHILAGFDQCAAVGTVITRTSHQADAYYLYDLCTPYANSPWSGLSVANVPSWDRNPLRSSPSLNVMLSLANPFGSVRLRVENQSCYEQDWRVATTVPWLAPQVVTGTSTGSAAFAVDAAGMPAGLYSGEIVLYGSSSEWPPPWVISRTIAANLWLADEIYRSYLPSVQQ